MANATQEKTRVPAAVEGFFKQLLVTYKGVAFYPPSSTFPREAADLAAEQLRQILTTRFEVKFVVSKDRMLFEDVEILPGQEAYSALAREFYNRGVAEMRFRSGTTGIELLSFLGTLVLSPQQIASSGGFEAYLWDSNVTSITVTEARVQVADEIARENAGLEIDAGAIDSALRDYAAGKPVERRMLVRAVSNTAALSDYFSTRLADADGVDAPQIRDLAHIAAEQPMSERSGMFRSIADAMSALQPAELRSLLFEHVLPEARLDDAMAAVVRQFDMDEVCRMLVDELKASRITREGVARALRNLALVSVAERTEVMDAAGAAMRGAGFAESEVSDVIERATPTRLAVSGGAQPADGEQRVEGIFQLLDLAANRRWSDEDDPGLVALEKEARQGVADGEVLGALVTLVTVQHDTERWATVMTMLEESLELLVARGEFEIASDIAEALKAAAERQEFSLIQRTRLGAAIGLLVRPEDVRALTQALRVFDVEDETHKAALRLLGLVSERAVGPLLELLAVEPEMSVRKSLVDLLSEFAGSNIPQIGKRVTDPRWYVVRNVVSVLGSTKDPAILSYLMPAVRHADPRVRRESIRALAGLTDRAALNLLVASLGDEDPQNVQLAARYLGLARARGAVPALIQVARGEGRGNRDTGSRVEAVEALGNIGSPEAVTVLAELAGRRGLLGSRTGRGVRVAAEAALVGIKVGA